MINSLIFPLSPYNSSEGQPRTPGVTPDSIEDDSFAYLSVSNEVMSPHERRNACSLEAECQGAVDTLNSLFADEAKHPLVTVDNPQVQSLRKQMVEVLYGMAGEREDAAWEMAVALLDRVLKDIPAHLEEVRSIPLASLLITLKFLYKSPAYTQHLFVNGDKKSILESEVKILNWAKWDIQVVTPLEMLGAYERVADCRRRYLKLTSEEDQSTGTFWKEARVVAKYLPFDYRFSKFPPSLRAAASLAYVRSIQKLPSIWNEDLERITAYKHEELAECFTAVRVYFSAFISLE